MKKYIFLVIIFFLILSLGIFLWHEKSEPRGPRVVVGDSSFSVDIADTGEKRTRGLGYRDELCEMCGMIFLFDRPDRYGFWMKGMRFPIDILWIRDGTIVHIERDISHRNQQTVYQPDEPADMVLEVNAGVCKRRNIRKGDTIRFEREDQ